jgi:hypothetical protein
MTIKQFKSRHPNQTEESDRAWKEHRRDLHRRLNEAEARGDEVEAQSIAADLGEPRWC